MKRVMCKTLTYKSNPNDNRPTVITGIVIKEDDNFLFFKTEKREYTINKSLILCLKDTEIPFRNGGDYK